MWYLACLPCIRLLAYIVCFKVAILYMYHSFCYSSPYYYCYHQFSRPYQSSCCPSSYKVVVHPVIFHPVILHQTVCFLSFMYISNPFHHHYQYSRCSLSRHHQIFPSSFFPSCFHSSRPYHPSRLSRPHHPVIFHPVIINRCRSVSFCFLLFSTVRTK